MEDKIIKFAENMQVELKNNSHKGDWEKFVDPREILKELRHHENKLTDAMFNDNRDLVKEYIADCANILMMLGNSYKLYE